MSFQPGANIYTQGFASRPESVEVPHIELRDPTSADNIYPVGKRWINSATDSTFTLGSLSTSSGIVSAQWVVEGGGSSELSSLSGTTGTAYPVGGNIVLTSSEGGNINVAASGNTCIFTTTDPIVADQLNVEVLLDSEGAVHLNGGPINILTNAFTPGNLSIGSSTGSGIISINAPSGGFNVYGNGATVDIASDVGSLNSDINIGYTGVGALGTTAIGGDAITLTANLGITLQAPAIASIGSQIVSVTNVSSAYLVAATDYYLAINSSGGAVTVTFPSTPEVGRVIIANDAGGAAATHNITLAGNGYSFTIPGSASSANITISSNNTMYMFIFTGAIWHGL